MPDLSLVLAVLVCLQVKHFVADYLLQPGWMLEGKGSLTKVGGYAHAAVHSTASLPALIIIGLAPLQAVALAAAEAIIHYAIDYTKAGVSARSPCGPQTRQFWALHGADQLAHHLTYAMMLVTVAVLL
jgi:hypothetical protein